MPVCLKWLIFSLSHGQIPFFNSRVVPENHSKNDQPLLYLKELASVLSVPHVLSLLFVMQFVMHLDAKLRKLFGTCLVYDQ